MNERMKTRQKLIKVARGKKRAELVLKNCRYVNVFTGMIDKGDIAISSGIIIGVDDYLGDVEVDCKNRIVAPGLIDGHVHIESSLMTPPGFASAVIPKGTTTVIADPHEIGNVCGLDGIKYMLEASKICPLDVYVMLPSCVPSTDFENAGAVLLASDLRTLIDEEHVIGLGEMMNYPGVFFGNEDVHDKLMDFKDKPIDGHAPGVTGKDLNSYILSGVVTDHECVNHKELEEKVAKGMYIHLREGSATKNVAELCRGITANNSRRLMFCTDDKHPTDIVKEGHIDYNIRLAIRNGINPITAIQMATLNTAECYGLKHKGAIAPGYEADLIVLSDLESFAVKDVYKKGVLVSKDGKALFEQNKYEDDLVLDTIHLIKNQEINLSLELKSEYCKVIGLLNESIITKRVIRKVDVIRGCFSTNPKVDILKLAVIERHKATGNIGLGLVEGYGLKGGAIGLTIAHDSHNIIVIGDKDEDMQLCVEELQRLTGGICIVFGGKVVGSLQLEVGGLMTDAPLNEVTSNLINLESIARGMGVPKGIDPFMTLAFLALPVIPELKVTDIGLFDTRAFKFVEVEE
jgi:adenine deaminase